MTLPKDAGRPRDPCLSPALACPRSQELPASRNVTAGSQWPPSTSADYGRGPQGCSQVVVQPRRCWHHSLMPALLTWQGMRLHTPRALLRVELRGA